MITMTERTNGVDGAHATAQALAARAAEQAQRRTMRHPDAELDPELLERADATDVQVREAYERVQAAEHRLGEHQAAMPDAPDGVSDWARRKTELAAELEAFEALRERAQAVRDTAHAAVDQAYLTWFRDRHESAVDAWRAERVAGQKEIADLEREKQERIVAANGRIQAKGAYINDLRRYLPKGMLIQAFATDEEGARGTLGF